MYRQMRKRDSLWEPTIISQNRSTRKSCFCVSKHCFGVRRSSANRKSRLVMLFWTNAIKFSDPNGTVSVDISDGSECLSISVSNHGKDIPKDRIAHIFNKFYQADESHSSEGTGIGLAVVKKVCELHGGAVSAKSESGTTTFTVVLPKQQNM